MNRILNHRPLSLRLGLLIGTLTLASCGQQMAPATEQPDAALPVAAPVLSGSVREQLAQLAQRPELQDADSQAILTANPDDPALLENLKRAYGLLPAQGDAAALTAEQLGDSAPLTAQATGKAGYAQTVAWGSVRNYRSQKASPRYSGLDWRSNGCSAPSGFGLGYSETFRPACDVHDFGYRNLPDLTNKVTWPYNKTRTDNAFLDNMQAICAAKSLVKRPACYAAATAYHRVVLVAGWANWHR
ncbi:phospholipase [Deinococcus sp. 14RED07]|uniref:phospholipase A2 n=1 Tax=unclassified Deinococcus TaxID=2623546 RepID=UPI001E54DCDC|nr:MULTISPECIES: phospholipase A2 [unclassified Deinococcus]MCD0157317.1 phospholipase [Deinococcus sp. 6GRE01]MCD0176235.1 phospholipase [Deinococcus sp. 14RED07]